MVNKSWSMTLPVTGENTEEVPLWFGTPELSSQQLLQTRPLVFLFLFLNVGSLKREIPLHAGQSVGFTPAFGMRDAKLWHACRELPTDSSGCDSQIILNMQRLPGF